MKKYITINPRYAHSNISILARATVEQESPMLLLCGLPWPQRTGET